MKYLLPRKINEIRDRIVSWRENNRESLDPFMVGVLAGIVYMSFVTFSTLIEGMDARTNSERQFRRGTELAQKIYETTGGNEMLNSFYQASNTRFLSSP